ncbi:hypothetical protein CCC_01319 [Paramagnetospirillum magnetotacticum MS-1]|uniref:Uncharacterized protein n=1 Tax=Paramagnetospirillum magnetotacticum MS-1 TaxID=272627 RepID=A0A0C2YSY8_PARME|nr:hypothetical protein CCC_01319 [Paramagnetospirillum magnetotacticum MS-1]
MPRFSARRMIPAHALALRKYRDGIGPVSRTCHNEHTAAALGQAEILGVEDAPRDCARGSKHNTSVRPLSPWWEQRTIFAGQSTQKTSEGVVAGGQDAGDVLPNNPSWVDGIGEFHEFESKVAALIAQRLAQARHRERLTGCAAHQHVDLAPPCLTVDGGHVAQIGNMRVVVGEHGAGERFDLSEECRTPAQGFPGDRRSFYPTAHAAIDQPFGGQGARYHADGRGYRLGESRLHGGGNLGWWKLETGRWKPGQVSRGDFHPGFQSPGNAKGALSLDKRAFGLETGNLSGNPDFRAVASEIGR